jgi:hypothetical protein
MKRASRKRAPQQLSPERFREYVQELQREHQAAWNEQAFSDGPQWIVMLGLHLRLVELERLADSLEELL